MTYRMFLDDERFPTDNTMVVVRSYREAVDYMITNGCPDHVSFDHDLGLAENGYDVAQWMVDRDMDTNETFIPNDFSWYVHSQNPIGKANIEGVLTSYTNYRKWKRSKPNDRTAEDAHALD